MVQSVDESRRGREESARLQQGSVCLSLHTFSWTLDSYHHSDTSLATRNSDTRRKLTHRALRLDYCISSPEVQLIESQPVRNEHMHNGKYV